MDFTQWGLNSWWNESLSKSWFTYDLRGCDFHVVRKAVLKRQISTWCDCDDVFFHRVYFHHAVRGRCHRRNLHRKALSFAEIYFTWHWRGWGQQKKAQTMFYWAFLWLWKMCTYNKCDSSNFPGNVSVLSYMTKRLGNLRVSLGSETGHETHFPSPSYSQILQENEHCHTTV